MSVKCFKHLTHDDRIKIEALAKRKHSKREIAEDIGCSISTIEREFKRGVCKQLTSEYEEITIYSADVSQNIHNYHASNKGAPLKIGKDFDLVEYIEDMIIHNNYSPDALIGHLKISSKKFITSICTKTLYNYIDRGLF